MYEPADIAARITEYIKGQGLVVNVVLTECGLNKDAITNMKKGSQIGVNKIAIIADYLRVSVDFLLGRTEVECVQVFQDNPLSPDEEKLIDRFRRCDEDGQTAIIGFAIATLRGINQGNGVSSPVAQCVAQP